VFSFLALYLITCFIGSLLICYFGHYNFVDSWFDFTSSLGNIGFSSGIISYTTSNVVLWICSAGMFLGRLEIIVVLLAGIKVFASIKRRIRR
jgi:trk system potassium uptake protein TrkH